MAAMAFYTDSMDTFGKTPGTLSGSSNSQALTDKVKARMHNEGNIPDVGNYRVFNNEEDSSSNIYTWWAGYNLESENDRVKEKLEGRVDSAKLCGSGSISTPPARGSDNKYPEYTKDKQCVWIQIRTNRK